MQQQKTQLMNAVRDYARQFGHPVPRSGLIDPSLLERLNRSLAAGEPIPEFKDHIPVQGSVDEVPMDPWYSVKNTSRKTPNTPGT